MSAVTVTPMDPNHYGVQIEEGDTTVSCRVRLTDGFVDDLDLRDVDDVTVVTESIEFLLDRLVATSIPSELSLDAIADSYPDYYDELRARVTVP